jgi:hypothetical protein
VDIASQVPDFEESKRVRTLDQAVTVIGSYRFLEKKCCARGTYIYIHNKVTELKTFIGKEL